jgi:cytochrome c oxidase subunit 2
VRTGIKATAILTTALVGCQTGASAGTPMSVLRAASDKARSVLDLSWGLIAICLIVVVAIGGLIVVALARQPRHRFGPGGPGIWPVARPPGGVSWIYVGIGLTSVTLLGSLIWSMVVLAHVASPPAKPGVTVDITAHQWWWQVHYDHPMPWRQFTTANEIHIPVGVPVRIRLHSADVIHSFWVPALSGKTDVIPGQVNETWIESNEPGAYRGQCAEYCGVQHAHMAFSVVADPPDAFQRWWDAQLLVSPPPASEQARNGEVAFVRRCASCHTVRGTRAGGVLGPDLTHLAERASLAANTLPNTPGHLAAWIADPQGIKPGNQMPALGLPGNELAPIQAYLATLK